MKKSILVLSALLTLVASGICLQSCSSEYEEYTTEEYGYYTEEEIAEIKALAEKYGLNVELRFDNCGLKRSIEEFEYRFQVLSSLKGDYEMIPVKQIDGNVSLVSNKKISSYRTSTRSVEKGSWSGSESVRIEKERNNMKYYDYYYVDVSISWDFEKDVVSQRIKGSVDISGLDNVSSKISGNVLGSESISFSGSVSGEEEDDNDNVIKYSFSITNGEVNTKTNYGSFTVQ